MKTRIHAGPKKLLHYKRQTTKDSRGYRKTKLFKQTITANIGESGSKHLFCSFNKTGKKYRSCLKLYMPTHFHLYLFAFKEV